VVTRIIAFAVFMVINAPLSTVDRKQSPRISFIGAVRIPLFPNRVPQPYAYCGMPYRIE